MERHPLEISNLCYEALTATGPSFRGGNAGVYLAGNELWSQSFTLSIARLLWET